MNIKTQLLFTAALLLAITARAQEHYHITGRVENPMGGAVANAAIIGERTADSSILRIVTADIDGHYTMDFITAQAAILQISAVGFEEQTVTITPTDTTINITLLPKSLGLASVRVSGAEKPLIERRADRTIFNVSASVSAAGGSAYDAVKKAPAVIVKESDNSITIAGKSSARVMLNGRLTELSAEDLTAYLQAIPSDNIDRIEVITAPPAQYEAAGNSGLINIVLKKNRATGLNGTARLGFEQSAYGTGISGATLNYRKEKLDLYGSANYTDGAKRNIERLTTYLPAQEYRLTDPYKKQTSGLQYTAGADYELNASQMAGVQFNSTFFNRRDRGNTDVYIAQRSSGDIDSVGRTINHSTTARRADILNLNYVWTIDTTGRKLAFNANRLWYNSNRNRDFETSNYYGLFQAPTGFAEKDKNAGGQQVIITTAQMDGELPYKWAGISLGGKLSFVDNYSSNDFFSFANGRFINDPAISNAFKYHEAVQALYVSAQKELKKWSFQAGLRGEATQTKGYSPNLAQTNTTAYFGLFPSAYATYKPSEKNVLSLTYNKRINRPGYSDLNPFRIYSSPYLYAEGNPYLRPSYDHTIGLYYTLRQKFTFSGYYEYEASHFGLLFGVDSTTSASYTATANFGSFRAYGVSASAAFTPTKWWEIQAFATGGVQQTRTATGLSQARTYQLPAAYVSANNSFVLNSKKTLLAELNAYYVSRQQQDLFYVDASASIDTGFKVVMLDKKLIVSLSATDIFATQRSRSVNQLTGQALNSYFDQRNLRLMLNYKFGSDKVKAKRERATGVEEEGKRT